MTSPLHDAFAHHIWATLRLIDACGELEPQQLATGAPGTYGSILLTLRHLVEADCSYLSVTSDGRRPMIEADEMELPELRAIIEENGAAWSSLLEDDPDPDRWQVRHRDDGSETHATVGIRLAQALHHGTDHRSQVCTALTMLGIEPPDIDAWEYGIAQGRVRRTEPTA
ncbi:MAG TPA: DinB family protein [Candidatus Limnocylindrales bacterium]|nr:DinB family protein [Candidatus Limnocylindrales bacterium]